MSAQHTPATARIQRRLERWELEHLRAHAAQLAERIEALEAENERLQRELEWANDCADSWRDDVMRIMEDESVPLGLTLSGHVVRVNAAARPS